MLPFSPGSGHSLGDLYYGQWLTDHGQPEASPWLGFLTPPFSRRSFRRVDATPEELLDELVPPECELTTDKRDRQEGFDHRMTPPRCD